MLTGEEIEKHLKELKDAGKITGWRGDYGLTPLFEFRYEGRPYWFWQKDVNNIEGIDNEILKVKKNDFEQNKGKKIEDYLTQLKEKGIIDNWSDKPVNITGHILLVEFKDKPSVAFFRADVQSPGDIDRLIKENAKIGFGEIMNHLDELKRNNIIPAWSVYNTKAGYVFSVDYTDKPLRQFVRGDVMSAQDIDNLINEHELKYETEEIKQSKGMKR